MLQQISIDSLPDSFVVFDLETTGIDASQHEIIEIAAIRFKKGRTCTRDLAGAGKACGECASEDYRVDRHYAGDG